MVEQMGYQEDSFLRKSTNTIGEIRDSDTLVILRLSRVEDR